jgi:Tol biopolymer transport system component
MHLQKLAHLFAALAILTVGHQNATVQDHASRQESPIVGLTRRRIATLQGPAWYFSQSPDARFLAYATDSAVYSFNPRTGKSTLLMHAIVNEVIWSPGGDRILVEKSSGGMADEYIWTIPVNPENGLLRGDPRRVTTGPGDVPIPSPDGKMLAFRNLETGTISVIPIRGGKEKVLAPNGSEALGWTADGKSIVFVKRLVPYKMGLQVPCCGPETRYDVYRVGVGGTPPVRIATAPGYGILTPDSRFLLIDDKRSGKGLFAFPLTSTKPTFARATIPGSINGWLRRGYHALTSEVSATQTISVVVPSQKEPRTVMKFDQAGSFAEVASSPDGRRVVALIRAPNGDANAWMANQDGSNRSALRLAFGSRSPLWSPDGKYIALLGAGNQTVYIVSAGNGQVVARTTTVNVGPRMWRSDSRAFRYVHNNNAKDGRDFSVHELAVTGSDRILLDLGRLYESAGQGLAFLDDERIVAAVPGMIHRFDGGAPARFATPRAVGSMVGVLSSHNRKWIAYTLQSEREGQPRVHVLPIDGGAEIVVNLPLGAEPQSFAWSADDRCLIASGSPTAGSADRVYCVPINGGPAAILAESHRGDSIIRWAQSMAGTLYYVVAGPQTTNVFDADLAPLFTGGN